MRDTRSGTAGKRDARKHPGEFDRMVGHRPSHESGHSAPSFLGKVGHAISSGVNEAVDYVHDYSPLRKDLPRKKPRK